MTRDAAYFTDSQRQQLYVLDLGRHGSLPAAARTLPLTGELEYDDDPATFELNGITTAGRRLITVQSGAGKLFLVDPRDGDTEEIDLDGGDVVNGDGLLLHGRTLYVVQNRDNRIAVVRLDRDLDDGEITRPPDRLRLRRPDHDRREGRLPVGGQRALHHAADARHPLPGGEGAPLKSVRPAAARPPSGSARGGWRAGACAAPRCTCASTVLVEIPRRRAISL